MRNSDSAPEDEVLTRLFKAMGWLMISPIIATYIFIIMQIFK